MRVFSDDKGNIAIMAALTMSLVIGGAGFGVETGYWYYEQVRLQQAADAAAYAAAVEQRAGAAEPAMLSGATAAAADNGFDPAKDAITLVSPAGAHADDPNTVEVELSRTLPRAFSAFFDNTPVVVKASATAAFTTAADACVLALDKSAAGAVTFSGSSSATLAGCVVMTNSLSDSAIVSDGSSSLTTPCMVSVGGVSISGTVNLTQCDEALVQQPPAADPYRNVPFPDAGLCQSASGGSLSPGTYCGGLTLKNTVSLAPGEYIIKGGELRINASADITGAGVTFFFMDDAVARFNGAATVNVSAPLTGPYAGMLFVGSRDNSAGTNLFNGTAASGMTGTIYFPAQAVEYKGNFSGANGCTHIVARTVEWTGNSSVSVDCTMHGMSNIHIGQAVRLIG